MNRLEHLLTSVGEECNEIGQRASKAARFGLLEVQPGQDLDNLRRMMGEFADLCGAIELLHSEPIMGEDQNARLEYLIAQLRPQIDAKKAKLEKYLLYAASVGTLTAALPAAPVYGRLIGRCAEGQCAHDDPSWCERAD